MKGYLSNITRGPGAATLTILVKAEPGREDEFDDLIKGLKRETSGRPLELELGSPFPAVVATPPAPVEPTVQRITEKADAASKKKGDSDARPEK